jgi:dTDP-4-dehydrorhamnose reductase
MKILLTGASGLVGAAVARQAAAAGHVVIGLAGRWAGAVPGTSELHTVDLTDVAAAANWVQRTRPDAVINAAAISDPAACEATPELSQTMNVSLPACLAEATRQTGARFLHISSEQVFDGEHPPYTTDSRPQPLNLYGRQKVESEQRVLESDPNSAIVRAPLLLGNSLSGRRSVHEKLFELWAGGGVARLYADEFRQVCSAESLAAALLELASRRELRSVLHWAGAELVSRYELGRHLATHFQVSESLVAALWRADTPAIAARRPANLALDLAPLDRALRTRPQRLDEVLKSLAVPEAFREWQRSR